MQFKVNNFQEYLNAIESNQKESIQLLHSVFIEVLTDYDEKIEYGMPVYLKSGIIEAGFAAQKNAYSVYILKNEVVNKYRDQFPKSRVGKGCLRYKTINESDIELIRHILVDLKSSTELICE